VGSDHQESNDERDERLREEPAGRDADATKSRSGSGLPPSASERGEPESEYGGSGNAWVYCSQGHRHWGRFGAAGLLIGDGRRVVLQHRAPWTHEGDAWGLPGGARDSHEDVVAAALREANEEAAISPEAVTPLGWWRDDHGGWSYTTVLARPRESIGPHAANAESTEIRWWPVTEIGRLHLHPGLAAAWPRLAEPPAPLMLVVDAANVVGARPDGWWRDRLGAARRLRERVARLARAGITASALPPGVTAAGLDGLLPGIQLVVEGAARPLSDEPPGESWWHAAVAVQAAPHDGDPSVAQATATALRAGYQTIVVTADRGLRQRLEEAARSVGPGWLLEQLPPDPSDGVL
jgi:8-oxo-dGTP pyrophosphatase MutT (NUDIX family)